MSDEVADFLEETARWRARNVQYWGGSIERLLPLLPTFKLEDFTAGGDAAPNPYLRAVVRQPMTRMEKPIAVGVVSNSYSLAQHRDVTLRCLDGVADAGVDTTTLRCEVGLSELGEWMNLRLYFPERFNHTPLDNNPLGLRLECFNSVDGSNRLVVFLGWLRFVCGNGMVIGETRAEIREVHNRGLDLDSIPFLIAKAMGKIVVERRRLAAWDLKECDLQKLPPWIDGDVTDEWGKKAACRVYHICQDGCDVEINDPFASGKATEKPVRQAEQVPGAASPARTLYDVSQALTWVATRRANAEERVEWQADVSRLIAKLDGDQERATQGGGAL